MKKFTKLIALSLAVMMLFSSFSAFAETKTSSPFKPENTYTHQTQHDGKTIYHGLDLSEHNGTVDFAKLKKAGVEYVILRIGVRGWGKNGTLMSDAKFEDYYTQAKKQNIKIGCYFYSQALTENEAIDEAELVLRILAGRALDLPIAYDYEFASVSDGRLDKAWANRTINKDMMTNNVLAFCNRIKQSGNRAMLYCNKSFSEDNVNYSVIEKAGYPLWLAHYTYKTDCKSKFDIWQYSETGTVDGVNGNVDCNFMYGDEWISKIPNESNLDTIDLIAPTVKYESSTQTSIKIKWDAVNGVDGYVVFRYKNDAWVSVGETKNTSFEITGLSASTNYSIRVKSYVDRGKERFRSDYSATLKASTRISKVTGVKLTSRTDVKMTISWTKTGNPTGYNVYRYDKTKGKYVLYSTVTTNSATITGLTPNTNYKYKIEATKKLSDGTVEKGDLSDVYGVYTLPKKPVIASVTSSKTKNIKLTWQKNTNTTGYQVQWSTTKDFSSNKKSVTINSNTATSKTVTTYRSKYKYYIRVRSYYVRNGTKYYYSPWSATKAITVK